jgi:hypothetical protein
MMNLFTCRVTPDGEDGFVLHDVTEISSVPLDVAMGDVSYAGAAGISSSAAFFGDDDVESNINIFKWGKSADGTVVFESDSTAEVLEGVYVCDLES